MNSAAPIGASLAYSVCSIGMVLVNKVILSTYGLSYSMSLLLFQSACTAALLYGLKVGHAVTTVVYLLPGSVALPMRGVAPGGYRVSLACVANILFCAWFCAFCAAARVALGCLGAHAYLCSCSFSCRPISCASSAAAADVGKGPCG